MRSGVRLLNECGSVLAGNVEQLTGAIIILWTAATFTCEQSKQQLDTQSHWLIALDGPLHSFNNNTNKFRKLKHVRTQVLVDIIRLAKQLKHQLSEVRIPVGKYWDQGTSDVFPNFIHCTPTCL